MLGVSLLASKKEDPRVKLSFTPFGTFIERQHDELRSSQIHFEKEFPFFNGFPG